MIRILSRKLIKPSKATAKEEKKTKLSAIDEVAPPAYEPIILYYHEFNNNDKMIHSFYPMSTSLERLEKSLSETLSCFYPLAGRFNIDENNDLVIDCNDEGLEYWNVRVDEKLDQFIDTAFTMTAEHLNHLVPYGNEMAVMINSSSSRLVAMIQINIFKCGGIAICVAISHKIADGFTVVSFINGWATALKAGVHQVNKPSFNLASIFPPVPVAMRLETPINLPRLKIPNLKLVTKRFFFNRKAISILKEKVTAKLADDDYYPSSVEVVTALIWKALMAVSQVKHKTRPKQLSRRPSLAIHSFNLRGKIISLDNIPKNSCGNLYRLLSCYFLRKPANKEEEEEDMSVVQLHDLVCVFKKAVRNCNDICRKVENGEQVSLMVHKSWREVIVEEENFATIDANVYLFTSLCKFPFYEADFGWGKPIWVSSVNKFLEMVMLFDTNLGDGVEAWVTLNSNDMLLFQNDADILAFNQQHN